MKQEDRIEVCPDYYVTKEEYNNRYKGIDLERFRKEIPPKLFEAFVKTIGIIDGYGFNPDERCLEDYEYSDIYEDIQEAIKLRDKEWIGILENTFEPTVPMTLSYEKWVEIKSKMEKK